jgi:two-component system response regulator ChvI
LLERLRACRRRAEDPVLREAAIATPPVECGPLRLDAARHAASWREVPFRLTRIEFQLLEFLAERPGVVRRRQQMLDLVHGHGVHADDRTIDTHVRRLRTKIRAIEPGFEAIQTVHGLGYRFVVPAEA